MAGITNTYLAERILELGKKIESLDGSIRGHNGELGIQARLVILEQMITPMQSYRDCFVDLKSLVKDQENNIKIISTTLDKLQIKNMETDKETKKAFGSWAWFRGNIDKIIWTVVTVVFTTTIIFVLERLLGDFGFH